MEHGGAPVGASNDAGQAQEAASFEVALDYGATSENSIPQSNEAPVDTDFTADSHQENSGEGFAMIEGEEVGVDHESEDEGLVPDSEGSTDSGEGDPEVAEKKMDTEESVRIAKTEGFEPALEYYADFPTNSKNDEVSDNPEGQIDDEVQNVGDTKDDEIVDTVEEEEIEREEKAVDEIDENPENPYKEPQTYEAIMQNDTVQEMLQLLKDQSEIMKKMIERLEQQHKLTQEMLLMMAMLAKENLEKKKDKDEEDVTFMDVLTSVIGFLMGMLVDAESESKKIEQKVAA